MATPKYYRQLIRDPVLALVLRQQDPFELKPKSNILLQLCGSIMSQQLSTKVAAVIFQRFMDLFEGKPPTAEQILTVPEESLRGIGLSGSKTAYVRNVAQHSITYGMDDEQIFAMNNDAIIDFLLPIKGVGRWTIEMLLIFSLAREDVFAPDDYGIQQAMARLYGLNPLEKKNFKREMISIAQNWAPYRSYACLHLWQYKDSAIA